MLAPAERLEELHPGLPDPVVLQDEQWVIEAGKVCLPPAEFEKHLRNRAESARWMSEARNLIHYYRSRDHPNPEPSR